MSRVRVMSSRNTVPFLDGLAVNEMLNAQLRA